MTAPGNAVARIEVTDAAACPAHVAMVGPIVERLGSSFPPRGGRPESYERRPAGSRRAAIRFPSYQAAQDWYHSEDQAEARAPRQSASTSVQTIMEGIE